jgi:hypothetical protein
MHEPFCWACAMEICAQQDKEARAVGQAMADGLMAYFIAVRHLTLHKEKFVGREERKNRVFKNSK